MKIDKTQVFGWEAALRGMRNPLNSWAKSDSYWTHIENLQTENTANFEFFIGENDLKLAQNLIKSGSEHRKFLRMIHVQCDVDMPRYWWSEADTYHFNTKNSCSTMHKLLNNNNPITLDLFVTCEEDFELMSRIVDALENMRKEYKTIQATTKDTQAMNRLLLRAKRLLPEGFLQLRTWDTNYEEIRSMYHQRKNHRLQEEWIDVFCKWVESLPYAEELIIYEN